MKREKISQALGNISSRHIEEAIEFSAKEGARHPQHTGVKVGALIAACFVLIVLIIPVINRFGLNAPLANIADGTSGQNTPPANIENGTSGQNTPSTNIQGNTPGVDTPQGGIEVNKPGTNTSPDDPLDNTLGVPPDDSGQNNPGQNDPGSLPSISVEYGSIEEAHDAIKYNTLCSNIVLDESGFSSINTIFSSSDSTESLFIKPRELLIHTSYDHGSFVDMVDYYVLFNKESVDESYVDGYVEQGLTKEINGVTVHYCLFESDGGMQGQAKFLYDGNLYVIDVKSSGTECTLDTYIDMVLK